MNERNCFVAKKKLDYSAYYIQLIHLNALLLRIYVYRILGYSMCDCDYYLLVPFYSGSFYFDRCQMIAKMSKKEYNKLLLYF